MTPEQQAQEVQRRKIEHFKRRYADAREAGRTAQACNLSILIRELELGGWSNLSEEEMCAPKS